MLKIKVKRLIGIQKIKGLIGEESPYPILLKTRFGIHTFGLNFPIDVVILDEHKVVKIKEALLPNRVLFWNPKYNTILEMSAGFVRKNKIKIGSAIGFL